MAVAIFSAPLIRSRNLCLFDVGISKSGCGKESQVSTALGLPKSHWHLRKRRLLLIPNPTGANNDKVQVMFGVGETLGPEN
jgi:hypothetical protein